MFCLSYNNLLFIVYLCAGPLDGVPVAVKEEMDVIGYPTTLGTAFLGSEVAATDALAIARLRAAGNLISRLGVMRESVCGRW